MKIALFNVTRKFSSDGCLLIFTLLRNAGHSVKLIFLTRHLRRHSDYGPSEFEQLHEILKDVDLVMISLYSQFFHRAKLISEFVHENYPDLKVIWGGPHCIGSPEESLKYADGVCFGEGEQTVLDLVSRMEAGESYLDVPNMAFRINGSLVKNRTLEPFSDLDSLPYGDMGIEDKFILDKKLLKVTKELTRKNFAKYPTPDSPVLYVLTSRGCPHKCTYCLNARYIRLFGFSPIRFRSVDHFMGEMEYSLNKLDFIKRIIIGDDDFLMRPREELERFASEYKKRIGLPFGIAGSANTFKKEKMEILLDAGLDAFQIGVQSGSQRILDEVFNRKVPVSKTKNVIRQIEPYTKSHGLKFAVDFIIDNPYEASDDILQTYRYLLDLPLENVQTNVFLLSFLPGSPLYDRALKDGFIEPFSEKTFRDWNRRKFIYQNNYVTLLILIFRFLNHLGYRPYIPKYILRAMGSSPVRIFASIFPESLYAFLLRKIWKHTPSGLFNWSDSYNSGKNNVLSKTKTAHILTST
jgi:radical SAM superfamily enzyme YgiQ (UPF0313 family)